MSAYSKTPPEPTLTTPPAPPYSDRQFLHTYQTAAWVPLVQASVNAFMAMVLMAAILFLLEVSLYDYPKPLLITGAITWVLSWGYSLRRWFSLTALERRLQIDLNGDGKVEEIKPAGSVRVQIDEVKANGHVEQSKLFTLPCSEEDLAVIAAWTRAGVPFSEREYTGKGKPFSRDSFRELRSEMLKRGMLAPSSLKSNNQGYDWTRAGRAVLEHYAPSPTPLDEEA